MHQAICGGMASSCKEERGILGQRACQAGHPWAPRGSSSPPLAVQAAGAAEQRRTGAVAVHSAADMASLTAVLGRGGEGGFI